VRKSGAGVRGREKPDTMENELITGTGGLGAGSEGRDRAGHEGKPDSTGESQDRSLRKLKSCHLFGRIQENDRKER